MSVPLSILAPDFGVRRGSLTYPGLGRVYGGTYTNSYGYAPGHIYANVHFADLKEVAGYGDLIFTDRITSFRIRAARLVDAWITYGPTSGLSVALHFLDRRWTWMYATVNGAYNTPAIRLKEVQPVADDNEQQGNTPIPDDVLFPDGYIPQIQEWTRKNVRELGVILCKAMGERSYDVAALPDNQYPEMNWDAANPAKELQSLAERYGCRMGYSHNTDGVFVKRLGTGQQLPEAGPGEIEEDVIGIDPPEMPLVFTVYGGPVMKQLRFLTEAVGKDFDDRMHRIDELSYRPEKGWEYYHVPLDQALGGNVFKKIANQQLIWPNGLPGKRTGYDAGHLAAQWIYRAYRIRHTCPMYDDDWDEDAVVKIARGRTVSYHLLAKKEFFIPPESRRASDQVYREDIILMNYGIETSRDDLGKLVRSSSKAWGKTAWRGGMNFGATESNDRIYVPFHVDPDHYMVIFREPLYYQEQIMIVDPNNKGAMIVVRDDKGKPFQGTYPTDPVIETAVMLRDTDTNQIIRYKKEYPTPNQAGLRPNKSNQGRPGEMPIIRDEVRYFEHFSYTENKDKWIWQWSVAEKTTNQKEAERKAEYFATNEVLKFQLTMPQKRTYNGLKLIDLDGAIQQVTVQFDGEAIKTTASRNTEHEVNLDPYAVRRVFEELSLDEVQRIKNVVNNLKRRLMNKDFDVFTGGSGL